MFFRRERDMIVPGLVGGAVGALAAGYIVSRDGRKIPVDKNGNPVQGQAQGQAQAQGGEQQAANQGQNQQQQAPSNQQGQQQQAQAGGQQGAASGGNAQAEKPQAPATTQQPAATQNNATTQKPPVQNTPPPAQAPATPPPAQTQTPPPAQNTQPKPTTTTTTQPAGNTATTTTSQTTTPPKPTTTATATKPAGGNTTQTTQKPANNTTKTQTTAPKPTTQSPATTQNKNTQGQFKRPENFDRNAARQQKWQANRDRKDAGIARRNALQNQQKPAGNTPTGGFVRNTAGDQDTRRLIAMDRKMAPRSPGAQKTPTAGVNTNGMKYATGQNNPAAQTAANAAKQTGQHIRDRRAADPLDRIIRARRNAQADFRKDRLRTEAYKTNATSALGRAGDRTTTFFKRRGQDIKTGASAVGSGFKRAAGTFRKGGAVNGFVRNTGKAIRNMPARARVSSGFLKSAIKK